MDVFTLRWCRGIVARLVGRNPLVRGCDRAETFIGVLAVVVTLCAVPFVAALGTAYRDTASAEYAEQTAQRHQVTAIALGDSVNSAWPDVRNNDVDVEWTDAAGHHHVASLTWPNRVGHADPIDIWVDVDGNVVAQPMSPADAAAEAVSVALLAWLALAGTVAGFLAGLRLWLNRTRRAAWERDLAELIGDDRGRTNR